MTLLVVIGTGFFAVVSAATLLTNINIIKRLRRIEMNTQELLTKVDAATTAAANRVTALIASIKASGASLTTEQEAEANAITAHLDSIGADPANPVPAPPPVA